jgi:serine phosphatase RsbU (regulator of sigma subunit)
LDDENVLFVGLDNNGIARMEKIGGDWITQPYIDTNLFGVVRSLRYFDHKLYFSLQGKGVYSWDDKLKLYSKLKLDAEVSEGDGFVVEKFDDELWVGSERGLHKVEDGEVVSYNPIEGLSDTNTYVHRMYNDGQGKLWLVLFQHYKGKNGKSEQREIGYIEKVNGVYSYVSRPFKKLKKSTIHSISRWLDVVWFGGPEGLFYHQMNQDKTYDNEFEVLVDFFDPMHKKDSSTIFKNYTEFLKTTDFQIPHLNNYIKLKLACPQYFGGSQNEFRFLLEGYDGAWSDWSAIGDKVYSRLPHGSYILKFQARNYYGMESDVKEIRFTILPPWYFTWWAYLLYFVGAIFIIVLVARLSVNRVKQQKIHLEEVVKERTSEIAEQNNQLEHQKAEIIEKSNDILDSIKYAERIQQTILPADEFMEEMFEEHFVLFKPKDIVSGDFYWAAVSKKMFLFSAIDCTGHGVPGAFVSIVGHNGLTRAIKEFGHSKPSDILDTLREIVIDAFKGQGKADVKDGMDIALCGIDYENMVLHFAGAHNPCIIVRSGEMIEIKADKQPIGQFEYGKPFTAHEFNLKKGDVIYTYTDGYIDQFGGLKGKKFKSRPFKNLLLEIVDLPMDEQRAILDTRFIEWCGEHEQIDDVCVFGVRI